MQGDEEALAELEETMELLPFFRLQLLSYMAHRLRGVQQDCARELHFSSAPPGTVYVLMDYMAKWLPQWHRCGA
jgi:hypothetical protein